VGDLTTICAKNYWNQRNIVKIIDGGSVVLFFFETQCTYNRQIFFPVTGSI